MLLGVRAAARAASSSRPGHRLRVYVPYGSHWYEYSVRRLQENPRIAGYVAADRRAPAGASSLTLAGARGARQFCGW